MVQQSVMPGGVGSEAPVEGLGWRDFAGGRWQSTVDVRDFIQSNLVPYEGDASFLAGATPRTVKLWGKVSELMRMERERGGVLEAEDSVASTITAYGAGYIDRSLELIVGLQTDAPLKRSIMPAGGLRMVKQALKAFGKTIAPHIDDIFTNYRKDHNTAVFDAYTPEMLRCRRSHIITGLPDAYGRGRIIGDYRRVALYGVDRLIEDKAEQKARLDLVPSTESVVRDREEYSEQARALAELKTMAEAYGFDISGPARSARQAIQWTYLGYLAAVKEQNGAAMSIGRISTFLDIYIERDLREGRLTEAAAQELMDDLVIKLRMVRFLRTPEYNEIFAGDPTWVTECVGGMSEDGRTLVTKNSFRVLHSLRNLGPAPEPNLTVLWSTRLPRGFKEYCAKVSIETSSIQYENDDLMRDYWGDDYGIACCVSAMRIGKQMQFFGARCNLAKTLLYAINGGRDERTGEQIAPGFPPVTGEGRGSGREGGGDVIDYDELMAAFDRMMDWVAGVYVNALNCIHQQHDRYNYERIEFALHDGEFARTFATGIAGLSVVADSLSAIKYAKVRPVRNELGLAVDFEVEGEFPKYGNNDDRVDSLASWVVGAFMRKLEKHPTYRNSKATMSVLTITSNVMYGKNTGTTPDGRKAGEAFAPGANPMHGRDTCGFIASCLSVAKLPYRYAQDGISYTATMVPSMLGRSEGERVVNLAGSIDGYFEAGAHHMNVNVLTREMLEDAFANPEKYPQLTIRVSGYAVNFTKLTREQQREVISRTFHEGM
jgi:formate C-acetyltransferase